MITVSRIANASRGELLCITYELLLEQIELAANSQDEERKRYANKGIHIVQMLVSDLSFEFPVSKELFRIYVYVQGLLIQGKTEEKFQEAYALIRKIYEGFQEAEKQNLNKKPVMQNSEVIYAGLTYSKSCVEETTMQDYNRGFQV